MAHWSDNKTCKTLSREADYSQVAASSGGDLSRRIDTGSLQRIADALERIAARLDCNTTANAARALIRMDKRMAKRIKLP